MREAIPGRARAGAAVYSARLTTLLPNTRWDGFNRSARLEQPVSVIWEIGSNSAHTAVVFWMKLQLQFNSLGLLQSSLSRWIDLMNQNQIVLMILKRIGTLYLTTEREGSATSGRCSNKAGTVFVCARSVPWCSRLQTWWPVSGKEPLRAVNTLLSECHFVGAEPEFLREPKQTLHNEIVTKPASLVFAEGILISLLSLGNRLFSWRLF